MFVRLEKVIKWFESFHSSECFRSIMKITPIWGRGNYLWYYEKSHGFFSRVLGRFANVAGLLLPRQDWNFCVSEIIIPRTWTNSQHPVVIPRRRPLLECKIERISAHCRPVWWVGFWVWTVPAYFFLHPDLITISGKIRKEVVCSSPRSDSTKRIGIDSFPAQENICE